MSVAASSSSVPLPSVFVVDPLHQHLHNGTSTDSDGSTCNGGSSCTVFRGALNALLGMCSLKSQHQDRSAVKQELGVVGFDMEWTTRTVEEKRAGSSSASINSGKPSRRRVVSKAAVLQLATPSACVVLRLCNFSQQDIEDALLSASQPILHSTLPTEVTALDVLRTVVSVLSDETMCKVGVGVFGDKQKLLQDYGIPVAPCIDLVLLRSKIAADKVAQHPRTHLGNSLKHLAAEVLDGFELPKDMSIVLSDWADGSAPLTADMVEYAARDALVSALIAHKLLEQSAGGSDAAPAAEAVLQSCCDVVPTAAAKSATKEARRSRGGRPGAPPPPAPAGGVTDESKLPGQGWYEGRKQPYYDNIEVVQPDGVSLLFTVDHKKAEWYVYKKELAHVVEWREGHGQQDLDVKNEKESCGGSCDVVEGDSLNVCWVDGKKRPSGRTMKRIQLTFTPNFDRYNDAHIRKDLDYFRQPKDNCCVVCGGEEGGLIRHCAVPTSYRKHFPSVYVSHNSYDMLLVCSRCFPRVTYFYDAERREIADEFGFPLATNSLSLAAAQDDRTSEGFKAAHRHRHVVHCLAKYASALARSTELSDRPSIPDERIAEMTAFLETHVPEYEFLPQFVGHGSSSSSRRTAAGSKRKQKNKKKSNDDAQASTTEAQQESTGPEEPVAVHGPPFSLGDLRVIARCRPETVRLKLQVNNPNPNGDSGCQAATHSIATTLKVNTPAESHSSYVVNEILRRAAATAATPTEESNNCQQSDAPASSATSRVPIDDVGASDGDKELHPLDRRVVDESTKQHDQDFAIGEFILRWRMVLVRSTTPRFLPVGWHPAGGILLRDEVKRRNKAEVDALYAAADAADAVVNSSN